MKKILCMAMLALLLAGCVRQGTFTKNAVESATDNSWSVTYEQFDGSRELAVVPPEGQAVDFAVKVATDSGTISLTITGAGGETFYEGTDVPASEFVVHAEGDSRYIVRVEGRKHAGGFSIAWSAAQ